MQEKAEFMWDLLCPQSVKAWLLKCRKHRACAPTLESLGVVVPLYLNSTQPLHSTRVAWNICPKTSAYASQVMEPLCSELEPLSLQFLSLPCDAICQGFLRALPHPSTTHKGVAGGCRK